MRKSITDLIDLLRTSTIEIANSAAEDREARLTKSLGEFQATLLDKLDPLLPPAEEPLAKGLNHIATFAQALRDIATRVKAMQTGQPSWMVQDSSDGQRETLPDDISEQLDNFIRMGVVTLRAMVNDTAELPDEGELERMQAAGELVKIETVDGSELLVKTALPQKYHEFLADPREMLTEYALLGRSMANQALAFADDMAKNGELDPDVITNFPELFEPDPLLKAIGDENAGGGGDPDRANDEGSDPNTDLSNDAPQDPIELMVRMASIIVVVGGSLLQAQQGVDMTDQTTSGVNDNGGAAGAPNPPDATAGATGNAAAGGNAPPPTDNDQPPWLKRRGAAAAKIEPSFGEIPLAKILDGTVAVDPSIKEALDELLKRRGEESEIVKAMGEADEMIKMLRGQVATLGQQLAPPKGAVTDRFITVDKQMDSAPFGQTPREILAKSADHIRRLQELNPEGDQAARELVKMTHRGGGTPYWGPPER